jgi:hypothetical protein
MYYLRRKIFSINVITPLLVITATSIDYFTTTIHSAYGQAIQRSSDSNNTARDVSERYIAKSNPYIVMVSTPRYQGLRLLLIYSICVTRLKKLSMSYVMFWLDMWAIQYYKNSIDVKLSTRVS